MTCSGSCECTSPDGAVSGSISDGPGDYSSNQDCAWVLSGQGVTIKFTSFDTESGFDYVTVNQCQESSCSSPERLARLSGLQDQQSYTSTTGFLQVIFESDGSVNKAGFVAEWSADLVCEQTPSCPPNSDAPSGSVTCLCNPGYTGPDGGPCQACGAGTYKDSPGSGSCTACQPGEYSSSLSLALLSIHHYITLFYSIFT